MADPVTQIETAPLFKGATRPACILGVPTETFVITVLTGMVISLLFWPPLMLLIPIPVGFSNGSRIEMIRSSINGNLL